MSVPSTRREPSPVRIALVSGQRGPYDMFDLIDDGGVTGGRARGTIRVRGPLLLEVGEELDLHIERGAESTTVRGRVISNETRDHEAVTTFALVGDAAVAGRLLGS